MSRAKRAGRNQSTIPSPPAATGIGADTTDESLLVLVRDPGNQTALAALLERLDPDLRRTLSRMLPGNEVDDVLAEVQERIWRHRHRYRHHLGTVRAWARGIARHRALDRLRQLRARPDTVSLGAVDPPDAGSDPSRIVEQAEVSGRVAILLEETLARFPAQVGGFFRQRLEGVRYVDIARAAGLPLGTVATTVHRVRQQLAMALRRLGFPDLMKKGKARKRKGDRSSKPSLDTRVFGDGPRAKARLLLDRLRRLIEDPNQHRSEEDWEDLLRFLESAEGLLPLKKHLPRGLYTGVVTRLKESRALLREVPGHQAALNQLRQVESRLQQAIGPGAAGSRAGPT